MLEKIKLCSVLKTRTSAAKDHLWEYVISELESTKKMPSVMYLIQQILPKLNANALFQLYRSEIQQGGLVEQIERLAGAKPLWCLTL